MFFASLSKVRAIGEARSQWTVSVSDVQVGVTLPSCSRGERRLGVRGKAKLPQVCGSEALFLPLPSLFLASPQAEGAAPAQGSMVDHIKSQGMTGAAS